MTKPEYLGVDQDERGPFLALTLAYEELARVEGMKLDTPEDERRLAQATDRLAVACLGVAVGWLPSRTIINAVHAEERKR